MYLKKVALLLVLLQTAAIAQKNYTIHTVAFYNFENLFDTINDPQTNDEEWTPSGTRKWVSQKYNKKLQNLAKVLSEIGTPDNKNCPTLIGASEVENRGVLEDLIKQPDLISKDFGIVHFNSPDKRGIDVALLYQKKYFIPISTANIPLYIFAKNTNSTKNLDKRRVYTRDQLLVTGFLVGEKISIIVNHWPSRSGGEKVSSPFREEAGRLTKKIIDSLQKENPNQKIIIMGDFNDSPIDISIKQILNTKSNKIEVSPQGIYNPYEELVSKGFGTLSYRDVWYIFDQIMITESFLKTDDSSFRYWKSGIYNKSFLIQKNGKYQGSPLRTSATEVGYSDHFPVYLYLIKPK